MQQSYYVRSYLTESTTGGTLWNDRDRKAAHLSLAEQRATPCGKLEASQVTELGAYRSLSSTRRHHHKLTVLRPNDSALA